MTRKLTLKMAINEAIDQEMARDPKLMLFGQDTAGGVDAGGEVDCWGGVLGVTKGLYTKYGDRVIDAPPTEMAYVGAAIGAAVSGVPVIAEVPFIDFMGVCFDQLLNQAAKMRYMFGGKAETPVVIRTGRDVSIITYGPMVQRSLSAAEQLAEKGINVEVVDLRSLSPLDLDTVLSSVQKTGRLVAVDEAYPRCNIATDIVAQVTERQFGLLKAAPQMVSAPHTPVPFSPVLEEFYIPSVERIIQAVEATTK